MKINTYICKTLTNKNNMAEKRFELLIKTLEEQSLNGSVSSEEPVNDPVILINGERYFTYEQLQKRLRLSRKYIYSRTVEGRLSTFEVPGLKLYRVNY